VISSPHGRRAAPAAALTLLALLTAGCTNVSDESSTSVTATVTPTPAAGDSGPASPDQTSAILVQPIHDAQVVLGTDGKDHVDYELMVTSIFAVPVTLTSVTVLDRGGAELGRIDGETLVAGTQMLLTREPTSEIEPSTSVSVDVDLALEPGTAPQSITHRIEYSVPDPHLLLMMDIDETVVHGPEVTIDDSAPLVIEPPVAGDGWLVSNGCCAPNLHRDLRLSVNGSRIETPETFAIDWARVEDGRIYDGDGSENEQHYAFGADVFAVAEATVIEVREGQPEQLPDVQLVPQSAAELTGNLVVLELESDVFAAYGHLQPGSITVEVGDTVTAGQLIATLGNSGPSGGPHLHFALVDQPNIFTARSLPYVFERFTVVGTIDFADSTGDNLAIAPESKEASNAHPLYGAIVDFAEN